MKRKLVALILAALLTCAMWTTTVYAGTANTNGIIGVYDCTTSAYLTGKSYGGSFYAVSRDNVYRSLYCSIVTTAYNSSNVSIGNVTGSANSASALSISCSAGGSASSKPHHVTTVSSFLGSSGVQQATAYQ